MGLLAGVLAVSVLNLPYVVAGFLLSIANRMFVVVVAGILYYLIWMVVRAAYCSLAPAVARAEDAKPARAA